MARCTASASATVSSGTIGTPYAVRARSAISAVVSCSVDPSLRRKPLLAVDRPQVELPKLRVFGHARNDTTTASPELATRLSASTATRGGPGVSKAYGVVVRTISVVPLIDA